MKSYSENILRLREMLKAQLSSAREMYALSLELETTPHPMMWVPELFRVTTFPSEGKEVAPYATFLAGVCIGYDAADKPRIRLRCVSVESGKESGNAPAAGEFVIEAIEETEFKWLSLEFEVFWPFVRSAKTLTVGAFGSKELFDSTPKGIQSVQLFAYDTTDKRHDLIDSKDFVIPDKIGQARVDAAIQLSAEIYFDFKRNPTIALFLPSNAKAIHLTDLFIDFTM